MSLKGPILASLTALAAVICPQSTRAEPASAALSLRLRESGVTKVDYYYSGYRPYRDYDGGTPFDIPGKIIGGAFGLVTGALTGAVEGLSGDPFFGDPYYSDRAYRDAYYGSWNYDDGRYGYSRYDPYHANRSGRDWYYDGRAYSDRYYDGGYGGYSRGGNTRWGWYADRYRIGSYDRGETGYSRYAPGYDGASGYGAASYYGGGSRYGSQYGRSSTDDAVSACEQEYRSFDPQSGTIVTYEGDQVLCPYLR